MLRTCGSPMPPASFATAGIAACTTLPRATSACRVMAPITRLSPSRVTPASSGTFLRSMSAAGDARRCFMVGSRVMPPASALASALARSATAPDSDWGRWYSKAYMSNSPKEGNGSRRIAAVRSVSFRGALHHGLLRGAPDDLRSRGHRHVFVTERIGEGVDDGRRRGDRARFPATFDAKRIGRADRLDRLDLERGQ